jgi:hypothetical protein
MAFRSGFLVAAGCLPAVVGHRLLLDQQHAAGAAGHAVAAACSGVGGDEFVGVAGPSAYSALALISIPLFVASIVVSLLAGRKKTRAA